jgi:hypothetical protein
MKKSTLLLKMGRPAMLMGFISLTLMVHPSQAQMAIAFGPKAGLAITSFKTTDAHDITSRSSWQGGLFLNWQLHPIFAIQPEAIFSQKGATYTKNGNRTEVKLNYFEIPVLAKLRIPMGDVFFPHFLIGPDFAFNTDAKYTSTDTQTGTVYQSEGGNITKTDMGGLIGAGFDIQAKQLFFTMDGRYGYAFNTLGDNEYNVRNIGWAFTIGIGLRFGSGSGL